MKKLRSQRTHRLGSVQVVHNRLQGEKSRLAVAVQACEAAAACISRPSSPQDTAHAPIPDREIAVRVRLEDLIDQVCDDFMSLKFCQITTTCNLCCSR